MKKTITRFQRLQLTVIVAALVAPLLSFTTAPAHAVAATCAEGGVCQVGDIGPGGGKVFYVAPNNGTFEQIGASGAMCTTNCKYLEAAPNTWSGGSSDPARTWATNVNSNQTTAVTGADGTAIGTGYKNSLDIVAQTGNLAASSAAVAARGYRPTVAGTTYTDWFLPSKDELNVLYFERATVGGFVDPHPQYWSSSEYVAGIAWHQDFLYGTQFTNGKFDAYYVRPIRAFAPATNISITRAAVGTQRRTAFTTQPQITIQFSNNETVTASSAVVTASISSGGTLIGTTTATASSGVATFSNLGVDGTIGTTYTISYTALDLPVASATVTLTGTTCDGTTFTCQVGDIGPGGGTIFYVAPTTFTQLSAYGSMCKTWCKYLEAAPSSWFEGGEPTRSWATDVNNNRATTVPAPGAQQTAIGTGYQNSTAIVAQTGNVYATSAAVVTRTYRGQGLTDWYLPSKDELNVLYAQKTSVGGLVDGTYWSSSENSANKASDQMFLNSTQFNRFKNDTAYLRPIRAFGTAPTTISIANVVIPAPVLGATPVDSITSNGQYTTAITWSGSPTTFAASTAYTATVTVTPVAGYTLDGVGNGFFTINGNAANGVINSTNIATTGVAPYAVAADGQGNIYLANKSANNVTKITPIGVTSILGTTGTSPHAISVDPDGNVYTANQGSDNVTKLTAQGVSTVLMVTGNGPNSILYAAGSVYTANSGTSNDVSKKPAQGNQTKINLAAGSSPSGITIDTAGNIYTSNRGLNNVTKITPQGVSSTLGTTGLEPAAITIDSAGNIYTANYSSNNVTKITPQGVSSILGTTSGGPNAITIDAAGNIYTANYSSNNVTKITPQGVSSTYGTTSNYPTGITVDSEGNIYTANYGSNNVTRFPGTNSGVFTYQFPATAAPAATPTPTPTPSTTPSTTPAPPPPSFLKVKTSPTISLAADIYTCTAGTLIFWRHSVTEEPSKLSYQKISLLRDGTEVASSATLKSLATFEKISTWAGSSMTCQIYAAQENTVGTFSSLGADKYNELVKSKTAAIKAAEAKHSTDRKAAYDNRRVELSRISDVRASELKAAKTSAQVKAASEKYRLAFSRTSETWKAELKAATEGRIASRAASTTAFTQGLAQHGLSIIQP